MFASNKLRSFTIIPGWGFYRKAPAFLQRWMRWERRIFVTIAVFSGAFLRGFLFSVVELFFSTTELLQRQIFLTQVWTCDLLQVNKALVHQKGYTSKNDCFHRWHFIFVVFTDDKIVFFLDKLHQKFLMF